MSEKMWAARDKWLASVEHIDHADEVWQAAWQACIEECARVCDLEYAANWHASAMVAARQSKRDAELIRALGEG